MSDEPTARRKKLTSLALAGAVFTGGAAGAAVTMVGAGAQDDTTTTTEAPADGSTDESHPDRGDRLSEALAPLVEDGTITQEQSDAVRDQLLEAMPGPGEFGHRGHGGHLGHNVDAIAEALGMDAETLATELRDGSSLADIAEAQGVDIQAVIDILVADLDEHLAGAVEDGRITQEEADDRRADAVERITESVNDEMPFRGPRGPGLGGPHGHDGDRPDAGAAADSAGVSVS